MSAARPWAVFGICMAVGFAALGVLTALTVRSGRAEAVARQQARRDDDLRQALWLLDNTASLFLGPEAGRPPGHYRPLRQVSGATVLSPFLQATDEVAKLRFRLTAQGDLESPLVLPGSYRPLAQRLALRPEALAQAPALLAELRPHLAGLRERLVAEGGILLEADAVRQLQGPGREDPASPFHVVQSPVLPLWLDGRLLVVRQAWEGHEESIVGCWADWDLLKEVLLSSIRGRQPQADLQPVATRGLEGGHRMATLPVRLDLGPLPAPGPLERSLVRGLMLAWIGAVTAGLAAAWLLQRALRQAEARGAFMSAVTHELRTPLTTFRLYTELLAFGMVPSEADRGPLLRTLLQEADRLDHLVKNVLSFARLEARRPADLTRLSLGDLLSRSRERLVQRVRMADLAWEEPASPPDVLLCTDPMWVEQILFNLVDNACKYGAEGGRVALETVVDDGRIHLEVRDLGPGLPAELRGQLFRPFHRGTRATHGVGLGLALCRRLARSLGGDLCHRPEVPGACFRLSLPLEG